MFKIYGGANKFKQWTQDNKLIMDELPIGADVMFYNDPNEDDPLITEVYEIRDEEDNVFRVCDVPNILLTKTENIKVRIPKVAKGLYGNLYKVAGRNEMIFEVEPAEKPADYVYEKTVTNTIDLSRLPTSVPAIESASVGQVPKVAAVDENGVPAKWEAGEAGSGEFVINVTVADDGTCTADKTFAEMEEAYLSGKVLKVVETQTNENTTSALVYHLNQYMSSPQKVISFVNIVPGGVNFHFYHIGFMEDRAYKSTYTMTGDFAS